ncbi:MAG: RNA polymerase sigma-70 factor [Odoribacter sp.]
MEFTLSEIKILSQGDKKVFKKLYENFFVALCVFAGNFYVEREEAEDIVQEVFCRLYDEPKLFSNIEDLKSYLYMTVRNRCLNYLRDEKRRHNRETQFAEILEDDQTFFDQTLENEIYRQLSLLLEELSPQCQNIFRRVLNGDTSEKIANDLGLSIETVKTQRKNAKKILRTRFALLFKTFGILF